MVALASLVYKRHIESPQRPWIIWALDVSKQLIGGFFVHFANIGLSELLSHEIGHNSDECAFYFLNYFVDCTAGVVVVYYLHAALCNLFVYFNGQDSALADIGHYREPPQPAIWFKQLLAYLGALLGNKLIVGGVMFALAGPVTGLGNWIFSPFQSHPKEELIVVMILCPWLLQTLQFWLFDQFLKGRASEEGTVPDHRYGALKEDDTSSAVAPSDHGVPSESL